MSCGARHGRVQYFRWSHAARCQCRMQMAVGERSIGHRGESTMSGTKRAAAVLGVAYGVAFSLDLLARQAPDDGPRYIHGTSLVRPTDYREWIFLSSGLDMAYNPPPSSNPSSGARAEQHTFTNVF